MLDTPLMLWELSMTEQRYRAVLEAGAGVPVTEVAERYEVSWARSRLGLPAGTSGSASGTSGSVLLPSAAVTWRLLLGVMRSVARGRGRLSWRVRRQMSRDLGAGRSRMGWST